MLRCNLRKLIVQTPRRFLITNVVNYLNNLFIFLYFCLMGRSGLPLHFKVGYYDKASHYTYYLKFCRIDVAGNCHHSRKITPSNHS